ncbi:phage portal protein [Nesterenkonia sp. PF2B19]|uniref:phage portal protein n=1 Tax=Nesterenkonia sp. PF2B19 TaxID=1881858 RepID=UPI00087297DC|nr:phage portal protein [Nesterenkonia sp. PF2B19]OSM43469.1 phage portal protein [Nesterenkonia sp. PF2B19]
MPILREFFSASDPVKRGRMPRLGGTSTAAGVAVDAERALQVSAVYGCVRLISEAIAQLPVHVYRRTANGREQVRDHPLIPLLTDRPNPDVDAGEFFRGMVGWMLLRGNGIAYREIGGDGRTKGLWPIAPTSVEMKRTASGKLSYLITLNSAEYVPGFTPGQKRAVPQDRILHFRAFGMGNWGLSPIGLARTKIGTAFAAEEYGAGFFARGALPGGVLTTDGSLTDEQFDRLNQQWNESHGGFGKSHKPAVLEGGVSWENVGLPPAEAQFLETQKYTSSTIAGHIFFVPPHLIGDVERSTSWGSGIAEQGVAFVRYSLMPWIVRLERVLNRLFAESDLYVKFNAAALERGDIKTRYDAYAIGKQWGWLSTNDILRKEDESPVDGGDVYLHPLNMVPAGTFDEPERARRSAGAATRSPSMRERHVTAHERALSRFFADQQEEVLAEYTGRGARAIDRESSDRELARLLASLGLSAALDSSREVLSRFGLDLDDGGFAGWMSTMGRNTARQINDSTFSAVASASNADEIRNVFENLTTARASQIAVSRVTEAFGFGRQEAAKQSGAKKKTWRTNSGNPRSEHAALDGETVDVGDTFSNGARWPGDWANLDADQAAGCQCDMEIST